MESQRLLLLVPEQGVGVVTLLNLSDDSVDSALSNIGWNVGLIALGLPPKALPMHEDWLAQQARLLMTAAIVLCAVLDLWLLRRRVPLAVVLIAGLVQVGIVVYLFLVRFADAKTNLLLMLSFAPDIGQMTVVLTVLAGWSVVWVFRSLSRSL